LKNNKGSGILTVLTNRTHEFGLIGISNIDAVMKFYLELWSIGVLDMIHIVFDETQRDPSLHCSNIPVSPF
jgi:hypothetical protein